MSLTIELGPDLEKVLDERVASGQFASRDEAVAYAVRLLGRENGCAQTTREQRLKAVRKMREIASRNTLGPDLMIRQLIAEGRKY
jgi:Arc/MetJ-type ribon-helix-helix transcriptional regulator